MINGKMVTAVIVAAGASSRMGFNKLSYKINGETVLQKSIAAFACHKLIDNIVVVCQGGTEKELAALAFKGKPYKFAQGAGERYLSVKNGALVAQGDIIAIHDAARPFVSEKIITEALQAASITGAAAPAVKVKDTIKTAKDGIITSTPPRSSLFAIQTPQVFDRKLYLKALESMPNNVEITDDCQIMEHSGYKVLLTKGEYENYKITTIDDLKEEKRMRIGHGYDVHRLCEGRRLVLGGAVIEHETGLLGHSDADVLAHAVTDALLGAVALGDIGLHFPDTAAEFEGANSLALLKRVAKLIQENGYFVENIDATILCQAPRLRPYIEQMRENIANTLSINIQQVNIKATTEEGLGFTGAKEGIAAHAVALLR